MLLHVITGTLLLLAAIVPQYVLDLAQLWVTLSRYLLSAGLLIILLGWVTYRPRVGTFSVNLCLLTSVLIAAVAVSETAFRLAGFDFRKTEAALRQLPPFYRKPTVPTGTVYFRRAGPERWTGQVIRRVVAERQIAPNPYTNEPVVTIAYGADGFRNESGIRDWELAVAGDSFTELGYLPEDQLFTTLLGRRLNVRVRNLGTSNTGPLSQLSYLEDYGVAPSLQATVIVFFEGNDWQDAWSEYDAVLRYQATGKRPFRRLHKQSSLLRALWEAALRNRTSPGPVLPEPHAFFSSAQGEIPVTFEHPPPSEVAISPKTARALGYFLVQYAAFAKRHHVTPWLAYMPCKQRVLEGRIRFAEQVPEGIRQWQPTDLARLLADHCRDRGVGFLNLTPALTNETTRTGQLLYNAMYDTHLNQRGSAVVADELARQLAPADSSWRPGSPPL